MSQSGTITLLMIAIPLLIALGVYVVLRQRGTTAATAGCICIVAGSIASFVIASILLVTVLS